MTKVLATGGDELVLAWVWAHFGVVCTKVDMAIAVMDGRDMVAAAIFQAHSGPDIELSYYGPKTMTLGTVKGLAKIAVDHFNVSRITVRTARNNRIITDGVEKLGFVFEGVRHHAYGDGDAMMYGLFGHNLARLAGKVMQ